MECAATGDRAGLEGIIGKEVPTDSGDMHLFTDGSVTDDINFSRRTLP
jgi:hypothetical protein